MKRYPLIAIAALLVVFGAKNALAATSTLPMSYYSTFTASGTEMTISNNWGYTNFYWFYNSSGTQIGAASASGSSCQDIGDNGIDLPTGTRCHVDLTPYCSGYGNICAITSGVGITVYGNVNVNTGAALFSLNASDTDFYSPIAPAPSIAFYVPTSGMTAPNFSTWKILGSNMPTDGSLYRFDVVYSEFGGMTTYDDFNISQSLYDPQILQIPKTQQFATGTTWTAQAFLFATSTTDANLAVMDPGDAIATTAGITFSIGEAATSTPSSTPPIATVCPTAPPIFELTGSLPYFRINNPIPSIISGGCNILISAFEMSDPQSADINSRYSYAATVFGSKPPFGYFTLATAAIGSFTSGSSSIYLLNASATAAFAPITDPLDTGLAAAIGLLGLFWLLRRLKHVQP